MLFSLDSSQKFSNHFQDSARFSLQGCLELYVTIDLKYVLYNFHLQRCKY